MNCDKCQCVLEPDEEADIIRLRMPKICTECAEAMANDWDEKRIDVIASGGEPV